MLWSVSHDRTLGFSVGCGCDDLFGCSNDVLSLGLQVLQGNQALQETRGRKAFLDCLDEQEPADFPGHQGTEVKKKKCVSGMSLVFGEQHVLL